MQRLEMRTITYKNSQLFLKKTWWVWEDLNLRPHPYQSLVLHLKPYTYKVFTTSVNTSVNILVLLSCALLYVLSGPVIWLVKALRK